MINVGICDDEKALAGLINMVVTDFFDNQNTDYNIIVTHTPDDFLKHKDEYDIVIIDVDLHSSIDGIETVERMQDTNKTAKVIIMSGSDYAKEARQVGCVCFLCKPFDIHVLEETLEICCKK